MEKNVLYDVLHDSRGRNTANRTIDTTMTHKYLKSPSRGLAFPQHVLTSAFSQHVLITLGIGDSFIHTFL